MKTTERLAKRLARTGLCSRRTAETWILQGKIRVNETLIVTPTYNVTTKSRITLDHQEIPPVPSTRLWRYHKPKGLLTTAYDIFGRKTVFDAIPKPSPHLISVGRLDCNTEGLLLFTNTGHLARHLTLPQNGYIRSYRVRVYGLVNVHELQSILSQGLTIQGIRYAAIKVHLERSCGRRNTWLTLQLSEGKNREVKKVLEFFGLRVARLIRTAFGPFQLNGLPLNAFEEISQDQLHALHLLS